MNTKIFGFLVILLIISIVPVADAQISIGEKSNQRSVEVFINSDGGVHVKHVVTSSNVPNQTELIYGTISNISVKNEQGKEKQFSVIGDNIEVLIFPSNSDSTIEYDLEHALLQKDNVWTWSFRYLETTSFIFSEDSSRATLISVCPPEGISTGS